MGITDPTHRCGLCKVPCWCLCQAQSPSLPLVVHACEGPLSQHHCCRDLKPENVLLAADGTIKLSDFGLGHLAAAALNDNMLQTTCGTPNYVAPEVLMRRGYQGGPADIWSLGRRCIPLCLVHCRGVHADDEAHAHPASGHIKSLTCLITYEGPGP